MKKILYKFLIVLIVGFSTSCNSILDIDPSSSFSEATAWSSEDAVDLYVTSLYESLKNSTGFATPSLTDGYTDLVKYGNDIAQGYSIHNRVLLQSDFITSSSNPLSSWGLYTEIRKENVFLKDAPSEGAKFGDNFLKVRMAEIRFIRAFNYFRMIRVFGGVVIRDEKNGVDAEAQKDKARATESESWDFVMADLNYAAENLPESWNSDWEGRLTKGAAYALICRGALYAKRWDVAIDAANKIKELNKYELLPNYADVFSKPFNKEIIFGISYSKPQLVHWYDRYFTPKGDNSILGGCATPTNELVDSYDMADGTPFSWSANKSAPYVNREPRFYASILYNGANWKGRKIETFIGGADGFVAYKKGQDTHNTTTGYYVKKYLQESNSTFDVDGSDQFWIELRYAEVLLNLAEALAEKDYPANSSKALAALNEVRSRVKLPGRTLQEAPDKNSFMVLLRKERVCELALEGFRFWDIRRWHVAGDVINGKMAHGTEIIKNVDGSFTYNIVDCDAGQTRVFPEKYYLLPIPVDELNNNPLCENNSPW